MREVDQPPANIVAVVLAPSRVNSLAKPTRPECTEILPSTPAALHAALNRRAIESLDRPSTESLGLGSFDLDLFVEHVFMPQNIIN